MGKFELMIKIYETDPPGVMSTHLDSLAMGETVEFKQCVSPRARALFCRRSRVFTSRRPPLLVLRVPALHRSIPFNIKKQYPFEVKRLVMLAGGTGIAPMIQALHVVLATQGDNTQITLLYGSRTLDVILGYELLNLWAAQCATSSRSSTCSKAE